MSLLYEKIIRPALFRLPAETAHDIGMSALRFASALFANNEVHQNLETEVFGLRFPNPLGLAAGFDKNAVAVEGFAGLGFGFVEVGTVTFEPQPGNPRPRLFRLSEDGALINRLGFNNDGARRMAKRLAHVRRRCVIGVNIGKNKEVPNEQALSNYLDTFELVHPYADYVTVNVSSPNTPNLRELQRTDSLAELLGGIQKRNVELGRKPLLVKISPDASDDELRGMADVAMGVGIDGIIATNTTVSRTGLRSNVDEVGGLSGRPLMHRSSEVIGLLYQHLRGAIPIIGVGGVFSAADAFEKIAAGASLIQAYTGLVYGGPKFPATLLRGLSEIIEKNGFSSISEAVGSRTRQ